MSNQPPRPANRLAFEPSPYLQQHGQNPVDWYPWGEEAFAKARAESKPIFLSIGYATCHWCHVMERESFEDETLAEYLNQNFVSIKVDREERPDVDKIYMTAVQAFTGQGGWPLSVFLTPDLKPFFGGTYFPPEDRHGLPAFTALLHQIHHAWQTRREDLAAAASQFYTQFANLTQKQATPRLLATEADLVRAAQLVKQAYDPVNGGFGPAPKFPHPVQPLFLLHYGVRFKDPEAIDMVQFTCERMAAGGIHDQLGGGFARYSVDEFWLVPHFEKMLYDNALLTGLYLKAYQVSKRLPLADTARDIVNYVLCDMTHPEGGFFSAEDADSEGKEGKFYCWTKAELAARLTPAEFKLAADYFGVTETGNFIDHSDPNPLPGQNVLSQRGSQISGHDLPVLASVKRKLCAARGQRVRPQRDEKILASWNGLMLSALAQGYAILGEVSWLTAARKNLAFIQHHLWDANTRTLYHRWREGERDSVQLLNGYAFLLAGVLDLYQATLQPADLEFAVTLADVMIQKFYDTEQGGFWQSADASGQLILRLKEDYDGAEPSGNSVAVRALLVLAVITGRVDFRAAAEHSLHYFTERLRRLPQSLPALFIGLDFYLTEPRRVVICGKADADATRALIQAAHSAYQPNLVICGPEGPVEPFVKTLPAAHNKAVAYPCSGTTCQTPMTDPQQLSAWISQPAVH